jgi:hypothetical protein
LWCCRYAFYCAQSRRSTGVLDGFCTRAHFQSFAPSEPFSLLRSNCNVRCLRHCHVLCIASSARYACSESRIRRSLHTSSPRGAHLIPPSDLDASNIARNTCHQHDRDRLRAISFPTPGIWGWRAVGGLSDGMSVVEVCRVTILANFL